jgi:serine protease Do
MVNLLSSVRAEMTQPKPKSRFSPAFAAMLLATGALAGAGGIALADDLPHHPRVDIPTGIASKAASKGGATSLADMVEAVGPSVVQIQVTKQGGVERMSLPFDGMNDELRRFFGFGFGPGQVPQGPPVQHALGSGFIIDPSGIVLTNNHVVDGASEVKVKLSDGREYQGTVLGTDPKTDIAVVRIKSNDHFKAIQWGDSDHIRVGDSVFAVGSPFGLGNTVTAGIVSARSRDIGQGAYDDFLQVDAAINSGNSGGPLFDSSGRVVGVNTAIYSPSGGNVGIGFAIPEAMARKVAQEIVQNGSVSRGHIGVALQNVTPAIADAMGLDNHDGALISKVEIDGPAFFSGLKQGDVVRSFDGKPVKDTRALARMVADAAAGTKVPVTVVRDGHEMSLKLRIGHEHQQS